MGWKINIDPTGRDYYFNPAGKNARIGSGLEQAVEDPQTAIALINALAAQPSSSNPASLNAFVSGTYFAGVEIPQFVTGNCGSASILTFDAVNVICGGRHTVEWGSLLSLVSDGVCVKIAGKQRVRAVINALVVGTDGNAVNQTDARISPTQLLTTNGVGFDVSGVCEEVFCELVDGILGAEGAILIKHTATSNIPIEYKIGNCSFFNADQIFMEFNPPNATDQAIVEAASIQTSPDATFSTAGSIGFRAMAGRLVVAIDVIQTDTIAKVEADARLALTAIVAFGDLVIETDAIADSFMTLMVGDITVDTGGLWNGVVLAHAGAISPSAPGDGRINGAIGGRRYGSWRVLDEILLKGADTTQQDPTTTDTPLQIKFGTAQVSLGLAADGTITIPEKNQYFFKFELQIGRAGIGGIAFVFFRVLVDGSAVTESEFWKLDGANDDLAIKILVDAMELDAGQEVTLEMIRDSIGMDDGSLMVNTPVLGSWTPSRSAVVTMTRRS